VGGGGGGGGAAPPDRDVYPAAFADPIELYQNGDESVVGLSLTAAKKLLFGDYGLATRPESFEQFAFAIIERDTVTLDQLFGVTLPEAVYAGRAHTRVRMSVRVCECLYLCHCHCHGLSIAH
jgi:hypothetical protein